MSFRAIELGDRHPLEAAAELVAPELQWVRIDRLMIDESYQRPLGKSNWHAIKRIAGAFSWQRFTPCLASPLEGDYYALIDGQHRTHAALMAGVAKVPCLVVPMDAQDQARAFASINGQITTMSTFHIYRAALAACEGWALACEGAVSAAGARLMTGNLSSSDKQPGQVYAVALVKQHVAAGRGESVTRALAALLQSEHGRSSPDLWTHAVLRPWIDAVHGLPDLSVADLAAFVDAKDLLTVGRGIDRMRAQPKYAGESRVKLFESVLTAMLKRWQAEGALS